MDIVTVKELKVGDRIHILYSYYKVLGSEKIKSARKGDPKEGYIIEFVSLDEEAMSKFSNVMIQALSKPRKFMVTLPWKLANLKSIVNEIQ